MSSEPAIEAHKVGKVYELGNLASLRRTVETVKHAITRKPLERERMWALKGVSFSIEQGECYGCLGRNGSGKSTLLSILSEVTVPSAGWVKVRGRVAPLLHANAGFQRDLDGTENVQLLATILGLPRDTLKEAMPKIADFAEIDQAHMRTPVGRFSSGMMSRLAFATVVHLDAEIYILDEVLAAADDSFKARCVDAVRRLVADGKTVIFVSHELPLVREICNRGMWLHKGRVQAIGDIDEVADAYAELHAPAHA